MTGKSKKRVIPRPVYFETTIPVIRPCRRCGVWLAAGVAEGIRVSVEFTTLDTMQALWATFQRIELYCITRTGLVHMDSTRLAGRRPGALHPEHRCNVVWPRVDGTLIDPRRVTTPPY